MDWFRVSVQEALAIACPECGAEEHERCTYIYPKGISQQALLDYRDGKNMCFLWSKGTIEHVRRYGKPTQKPHNGRRNAARERLGRERRLLQRPLVRPMSANARAASRAMVAWDVQEHDKLRTWLKLYGYLLTGAEKDLENDPLKVH